MAAAIDALQASRDSRLDHRITLEDSVSLVGRAVFVRFLIDRGLLGEEELHQITSSLQTTIPPVQPQDLFGEAELAAATCSWLDVTFNGDFLPVTFSVSTTELASRIGHDGWRTLGNILHKSPGGQLALGQGSHLDWPQLDFSRIPVGVLSQVYEHQSHQWHPGESQRDSVFYTPGPIAGYMVGQVFASLDASELEENIRACDARVLDPAVGGGVFLVSAFRELLARRWMADGVRPTTATIREVLYNQLAGFDRQKTALRLTALSLYLAAVEMDPSPRPLERLRFPAPLIGQVLFDVGGEDAAGRAGSLGSRIGAEHRHRYDVVMGNPPWTAVRRDADVTREVRSTLAPVVRDALGEDASATFALPDDAPDLGFLWRAQEWMKPGGRFALVTHARLLFKQSRPGRAARERVFSAFRVTGVLNGAALRLSEVWPRVSAPFAVVFGMNCRPSLDEAFYFVSPVWEPGLNDRGCFRIDAEAATPVTFRAVRERPWLLKTLFRGTRADVGVLAKVLQRGPSLEQYWQCDLGLTFGQGFQVATRSGRRSAAFLLNLPMLSVPPRRAVVALAHLPPFRHETVCWPRRPEIYKGPLALLHKTIAAASGRPRVFIADDDVAYNELFHGFSAHGHPNGRELVRYLRFVLEGPLFHWFALMTSSQYGTERDAILLEDAKRFPVPAFDTLPVDLTDALRHAAEAGTDLAADDATRRRWLSQLYDLSEGDWQVIEDSLQVGAPETRARTYAGAPPSTRDTAAFTGELVASLQAIWVPSVRLESSRSDPWQLVVLSRNDEPRVTSAIPPDLLQRLLGCADATGASQVRLWAPDGRVAVAVLRQRRYWTRTRARLLALDLVAELPPADGNV
ncbi:MAG: N-6 DNA methylase [Myxococcota bacterium]